MTTDTRITIETPEGAELPLEPAGIGVRMNAWLIDALIRFGVWVVALIVLAILRAGGVGSAAFSIGTFILLWFYPVLFEVFRDGQTPGKKSAGIMVVHDDGTPVAFGSSLVRNLLRVVDFLPLCYASAYVAMALHPRFKRMGDMAAGTLVVYVHEKRALPDLDLKDKRPMPSDFSTDEQRALMHFAERSHQLSPDRQRELAEILRPVLGEGDLVKEIKKMANSSLGGR